MKHLYAGTPPSKRDQIRYYAKFIQNSTDRDYRNKLHLLILVLLQILGYYYDIGAIVFNLELFFFALFQVECKKTVFFLELQYQRSSILQFSKLYIAQPPLSLSIEIYCLQNISKIPFAYYTFFFYVSTKYNNYYLAQFFIPDTIDNALMGRMVANSWLVLLLLTMACNPSELSLESSINKAR